jgi:hypothetical protein
LDYFPRNLPLSANCHWQAEGGWRREKNQTYLHFQPVQLWPTKIAARPCIE